VFSELWPDEKHGDATLQGRWTSAELDRLMPSRKERAVEDYSGEDQGCGKKCALATLCNSGRYLKMPRGEPEFIKMKRLE